MSRYFKIFEPKPDPVMVYEEKGNLVLYANGREAIRFEEKDVFVHGVKLKTPDDYDKIFEGIRDVLKTNDKL